nr:RNA-directed DNA polymerase, eukaryota, reverse transcriptase zinc-binding domain protein [Tanacetum cinerariifolium]
MAKRTHLYWTPCSAHCIDLMIEDIGKIQITKIKYAKEQAGKHVAGFVTMPTFWSNIVYILKLMVPVVCALLLVDGKKKPSMGYIYQAMKKAKESISSSFNDDENKSYHVFVSVAKFQRNPKSDLISLKTPSFKNLQSKTSHVRPIFNINSTAEFSSKQSYASVAHGEMRPRDVYQTNVDNIKSIQLGEDDLIKVKDTSIVVLDKEHRSTIENVNPNETLDDFVKQIVEDKDVIKASGQGHQSDDFIPPDIKKDIAINDEATPRVVNAGDLSSSNTIKEEHIITYKEKFFEEDVLELSKPLSFENFIKEKKEYSRSSNSSRSEESWDSGNNSRQDRKGWIRGFLVIKPPSILPYYTTTVRYSA